MNFLRRGTLAIIVRGLKCEADFLNHRGGLAAGFHTSIYPQACITETDDEMHKRHRSMQQAKIETIEKEKQQLIEQLCDARGELAALFSLCKKHNIPIGNRESNIQKHLSEQAKHRREDHAALIINIKKEIQECLEQLKPLTSLHEKEINQYQKFLSSFTTSSSDEEKRVQKLKIQLKDFQAGNVKDQLIKSQIENIEWEIGAIVTNEGYRKQYQIKRDDLLKDRVAQLSKVNDRLIGLKLLLAQAKRVDPKAQEFLDPGEDRGIARKVFGMR